GVFLFPSPRRQSVRPVASRKARSVRQEEAMRSWWVFFFSHEMTLFSLVIGLGVAVLVFAGSGLSLHRRRSVIAEGFSEEDLPWEELLELMKDRHAKASAKAPADGDDL